LEAKNPSYVYGPVPSRRLGRSLGVDLVPYKTCSLNCVYCQLGPTTCKTMDRKEYVPTDELLRQVERKIKAEAQLDFVTLSGSGEPTLHSGCRRIIRTLKEITDKPIAVLTNGTLLWQPELQEDLSQADLVVPSLDAGDAVTFNHVNRPHPALDFDRIVKGMIDFRSVFDGLIWLEVFLLEGMTGLPGEAAKIASLARAISPDRIQLNTVTRPPAFDFAAPVSEDKMKELLKLFGKNAEIISESPATAGRTFFSGRRDEVLNLLQRRPCTLDDVCAALGFHRNDATKFIVDLVRQDLVKMERVGPNLFYTVNLLGPSGPEFK